MYFRQSISLEWSVLDWIWWLNSHLSFSGICSITLVWVLALLYYPATSSNINSIDSLMMMYKLLASRLESDHILLKWDFETLGFYLQKLKGWEKAKRDLANTKMAANTTWDLLCVDDICLTPSGILLVWILSIWFGERALNVIYSC